MDSYESRLSGLRSLKPSERLQVVGRAALLDEQSLRVLSGNGALPVEVADGMVENVVGLFELPLGVAANFTVNDKDYLIPMAVEEPSVVAAASYMARIVRQNGGFKAVATRPTMRAQVQVIGLSDVQAAKDRLLAAEQEIIALANLKDEILISLGGGCHGIEVQVFENTRIGHMVVLHLLVDVRDAMGANTVNTMAEMVGPYVEELTGGKVRLRILSNFADLRTVKVETTVDPADLATKDFDGDRIADGIVEACVLAEVDPYRAATHNKGVMNGIDPVVLATGNDWRAVEAGAHAWAAKSGRYSPLTRWTRGDDGCLLGEIELPMPVGIVGGATKTHPAARKALELMRIETASELAQVICAVGLAQNMAALRALSTEGIQRGHMALHARNIAIAAGAVGDEVAQVASAMSQTGVVSVLEAKRLLGTS